MDTGALIGDMIRAGVDPVLIERTVDALIEMARTVRVDVAAERRREADRERKAQAKEFRRIPQNSAEIDEVIPSLSLLPPSQTLPPTHPHTPVREAKPSPPSVPATPPPEGTRSAYSKPKPPRPPSTADPRHAEFVRIFADEYTEATGQPYPMTEGGKDGQQLQNLLKTLKNLTADEWREGIRWSWKVASSDPFANACVRQTGGLAAFCSAWSRLVAYHATYQQPRR